MKTRTIMQMTLAALLPGAVAWCYNFGIGAIINLIIAMGAAVATEALVLTIRRRSLQSLTDGSALLTGALLGLCLPPLLPIYLVTLGVVFAVLFGKHLYGGTGHNVFNPAMVGFAVLIVSFPYLMSQWPSPQADLSLSSTLAAKASLTAEPARFDGITAATPLDAYRYRGAVTNDEFFTDAVTDRWRDWILVNLAFLAGGLVLLWLRIIDWKLPAAMLATLGLLALLFYDGGSSGSLGSPAFHLLSGATMLAAFFIITDPVTRPGDPRGLIFFGIGIGVITFIIRTQGAYPEGIAFAVLLMNAMSPLIDHLFTAVEQPA